MATDIINLDLVDDTEFDSEEDANNVYKELEKFKAKVRPISIYFGLPPDLVDDIQKRNHRDNGGALSDVINSWVRQEHNVAKFGYPCWRKVVEAAMGAGNRLQAKRIAKNHPAIEGVSPVRKARTADNAAPPPPPPVSRGNIVEFNMLDKRSISVDGPNNKKITIEYFDAFNLDRRQLQPIRFSFGLVHPKKGEKASLVGEYNMKSFPHGVALIINNEVFAKQEDREGTSIDERNLTHAFRFLGYKVEVHRNLNSKEMLAIMDEMGRRNHAQCDSFVCCILSHGTEGHVFGTDSVTVPLDTLTKKVDANNCPTLGGKPKLFFLQACRGKMKEKSVRVGTDAGGQSPSSTEPVKVATDSGIRVATDSDTEIPATADFFFSYATPLGFVAWRDLDNGTWYIAELCRALCELSTHASLSDITTQVCLEVGRGYEISGCRMSPEITHRLPKNVFF